MGCNLVSVDSALAPTIQRLVHENATLREAFNDANRRLSRLEDEKLRFFDEGIFDLVNSVCGKSTAFNKQCEEASRGWSYDPPAVAMSPSVLSTGSTVRTQARRSEEERRSAALSDENEELRRQLAHASEVGEVLEQQHQAAEDRMHALEQEHAWLAERLSRVAGANGAEALPPLPALPSTLSPASPPAVSSSAAPHSEAREATRAVPSCADGILRDAWHEPQSAQVAALAAERAQLEALERRLRDTEARAQMLAEENARLQAALSLPAADAAPLMVFAGTPGPDSTPAMLPNLTDLTDFAAVPALPAPAANAAHAAAPDTAAANSAETFGTAEAAETLPDALVPLDIEDAW